MGAEGCNWDLNPKQLALPGPGRVTSPSNASSGSQPECSPAPCMAWVPFQEAPRFIVANDQGRHMGIMSCAASRCLKILSAGREWRGMDIRINSQMETSALQIPGD